MTTRAPGGGAGSGPAAPGIGAQDGLAEAFWGVTRRLRRATREALAPWDIAPSHARALDVVTHEKAIRLSELSDRLHIAPRSTTEVVDSLEARGLVARRPDPHDRRATLVEPTREGHAAGAAIAAARAAEADRFFAGLSDADRAHLSRILRRLLD